MKRTIRVFSLLLAAVILLSAQALATEPAQAFTDVSKQDFFMTLSTGRSRKKSHPVSARTYLHRIGTARAPTL